MTDIFITANIDTYLYKINLILQTLRDTISNQDNLHMTFTLSGNAKGNTYHLLMALILPEDRN